MTGIDKPYRTPGNITRESWAFLLSETWSSLIRMVGMINMSTSQVNETPELTE